MYELKGSILDIIEEIKRRLYANFLVQEPESDYEVSNKKYVDDFFKAVLTYEGDVLTYEGELLWYD